MLARQCKPLKICYVSQVMATRKALGFQSASAYTQASHTSAQLREQKIP